MPIGHALLTSIFLILVAVSAAVVGSMVVLGLFDLAVRKEKPSKAADIETCQEETESGQLEQSEPSAAKPTPKPRPLTVLRRNGRNEAQAGCGPDQSLWRKLLWLPHSSPSAVGSRMRSGPRLRSNSGYARHEWRFAKNRSPLQDPDGQPQDAEALKQLNEILKPSGSNAKQD